MRNKIYGVLYVHDANMYCDNIYGVRPKIEKFTAMSLKQLGLITKYIPFDFTLGIDVVLTILSFIIKNFVYQSLYYKSI